MQTAEICEISNQKSRNLEIRNQSSWILTILLNQLYKLLNFTTFKLSCGKNEQN
jgi:hypothetical protein